VCVRERERERGAYHRELVVGLRGPALDDDRLAEGPGGGDLLVVLELERYRPAVPAEHRPEAESVGVRRDQDVGDHHVRAQVHVHLREEERASDMYTYIYTYKYI